MSSDDEGLALLCFNKGYDSIVFRTGAASLPELVTHLYACDASFVPPLSQRVDIPTYAAKLKEKAETFEAWYGGELVGVVAAYLNDPASEVGFITSVSVEGRQRGQGVASALLEACCAAAVQAGIAQLKLEVARSNVAAVQLYSKLGFMLVAEQDGVLTLGRATRTEGER